MESTIQQDLEIIKKALSKKHPCDKCHDAIKRIEIALEIKSPDLDREQDQG